ncbi:MAG: mannose-6-phosphate isomerase [Verrucomicrobiota bacterium]
MISDWSSGGGRTPAVENQAKRKANGGTDAVNYNVPRCAGARWNEGLMKFIERCVKGGGDKSESGGAREKITTLAKGAEKQRGENGISRQMRAFADEQLNRRNGGFRNVWIDPMQKGADEARGVFRGHEVARSQKNQKHPGDNRNPIFQKVAHQKQNHTRAACANLRGVTETRLTQPLVFEPIFMERVWGGRRLESLYGKHLPSDALIGESWEIVDRPEAQSVVHKGPFRGKTLHHLWSAEREMVFGKVPDAPRFPILLKLLDAQENLSLQVHPPAALATELGGESKSELWYVADAAPKARLFAGVKKGSTCEVFQKALEKGKVEDHIHALDVVTGDAIFLPSGRLHALGAGNLIVEIQENSDTTYRVYDWGRLKKGRARRPMHVAKALRCIDFNDWEPPLLKPEGESLVRHKLFEIDKWLLSNGREIAGAGRFAIVVCLTGKLECAGRRFKPGDSFLVPAQLADRQIRPLGEDVSLLRVMMPQ